MPVLPSASPDTRWDVDSPLGSVATTRAQRRQVLKFWLDGVWAATDCGAIVREAEAWSMWTLADVEAANPSSSSAGGARRRGATAAIGASGASAAKGRTATRRSVKTVGRGASTSKSTSRSAAGASKGRASKERASTGGRPKKASATRRSGRRG